MRNKRPLLVLALPIAIGVSTASAATIFFDTFTDGDRTNGTDTTDVAWYEVNSASATSAINTASAVVSGNNSLYINTGGNFRGLIANFAPAGSGSSGTLNIGEGYTLSLDFKYLAGGNVSNAIRVGLGDSSTVGAVAYTADGNPAPNTTGTQNQVGYFAGFGAGGSTSSQTYEDTAGNVFTTGTVGAFGTAVTGTSLNTNTGRSVLLSVLRTTTGTQVSSSIFSGLGGTGTVLTSTFVDTVSPFVQFNQVAVMAGNDADIEYSFDNVQLTYVPEPRAALLGGLGMLALLRRRR